MHIQFAQPYYLLALIPLVFHAVWMGRRLRALSGGRRATAIGLRIVMILLLVGALAGTRVRRDTKELKVMFALDASESLPEAQRQYAKLFIEKSLQEMKTPRDQAGVVLFGADAAVERAPSFDREFADPQSVVESVGTNIGEALQLATACFVGESQKRIVLLSDGNQTAGDAETAARAAAAAGIAIDVLPLSYENRNDAIVEKMIIPNRVSLDEPLNIDVIVTSRVDTPGKLLLYEDSKLIGTHDVEVKAGKKNPFTVSTQVRDAGFKTYEAVLQVDGDFTPENNRGFAFTYGEGEPRVLLVDGDSNPSEVLPAMLLGEKIKVERTDANGLPSTVRDMLNYDAIVFNNIPASDVTEEQMKIIESVVHDFGLGFAMIGGENSFGPGGYNDSAIERILPVEMELKNEKILPQGALVTIVHTCEIPDGNMWAEKITLAALDVLSPRDLMGVLYYSYGGGAGGTGKFGDAWLYELSEVGNKVAMRNNILGYQPADMPSFDSMLKMAHDALSKCGASVKHIIMISDGDPQQPNKGLIQKIKNANISVSTICIGPHSPSSQQNLQDVAEWGNGNYYYVKKFNKLPQIFIKEAATIRKSLIIEEPFTPAVKGFSEVLRGFDAGYPELKGYVGTGPKGLADTPLVTHKDDPLLAHWQHGIGKTVAFTSDAKERWATDWMGWSNYGKFWAQAVRWCLRKPYNQNYQVQTDIDGQQGKITIDAVDATGEFKNFLAIHGKVLSPSLKPEEVAWRQISPGRYEATFAVKEPGTYMFSATSESGEQGAVADLLTGGASLSYSPEFQYPSSNLAMLARLADITGGRVLDEKAPVFLPNLSSRAEPRPLWPTLLTAALAIFLADVFTRRVLIGWGDIAAAWAFGWNWFRDRYGWRRSEQLATPAGQLLKVKDASKPAEAMTTGERESFLASLQNVKIVKSPVAEAKPREAPAAKAGPAQPAAAPAAAAEHAGHTSQLLAARNKARKKFDNP